MRYIEFTKEQKRTAGDKDIISIGEAYGDSFKKVGNSYQSTVHIGLSIMKNRNRWHDFYKDRGGNAIKYLQEFCNYGFREAVAELLDINLNDDFNYEKKKFEKQPYQPTKQEYKTAKELKLPEPNATTKSLYYYLRRVRNIDSDIINDFYKQGKIYEDKQYHNVIFLGKDENNEIRFAFKRSTFKDNDFRGIVSGSNGEYGFSHTGSNEKLFVFESPIDMMSFISLNKLDWKENNYVSLNGVGRMALTKFLELNPQVKEINLALDNDEVGQKFNKLYEKELGSKGYEVETLVPKNKDWNEDLCQLLLEEKQSLQMQM